MSICRSTRLHLTAPYILSGRRSVHSLYQKTGDFIKKTVKDYGGVRVVWYDHHTIDHVRSIITSYYGHFTWGDTTRLKKALFKKFPDLAEFFIRDDTKLHRRVKPLAASDCVYVQYDYYHNMFKGAVLFFKVGSFCEFYRNVEQRAQQLGLRVRKHGKRSFCGFPVSQLRKYACLLFYRRIPVVFIGETGIRKGRVIERLPIAKLCAA